jgi:hypothetical protein
VKLQLLFTILFFISISNLSAQNFQFGAEAGPNLSGATVKDPGGDPKGTPLPGFQLGGFVEYALPSPSLSIGARLLFSYEGYDVDIYDTKASIHVSFLKIPINLIYHAGKKSGTWFFGLGPFFNPAIGGHYVSQGNKVTIQFGNNGNNDQLKRVDIGADLMAGYRITDNIQVRAAFDFGLINYLTPGSTTDASAHRLSLGITAVYLFGGK